MSSINSSIAGPPPAIASIVISSPVTVNVMFVPAINDLNCKSVPTFAENKPSPAPRFDAVLISPPPPPPVNVRTILDCVVSN